MEVYTTDRQVRLSLNGRVIGTKKVPADCRVIFNVLYEAGELKAEALTSAGQVTGTDCLTTASAETVLRVEAEKPVCHPGEMVYLRIRYTDGQGEVKPLERHRVTVSAENAAVVGTANGCTFFEGNYAQDTVPTYFGEAQAVVCAGGAGTVRVSVTDGENTAAAEIVCEGTQA